MAINAQSVLYLLAALFFIVACIPAVPGPWANIGLALFALGHLVP